MRAFMITGLMAGIFPASLCPVRVSSPYDTNLGHPNPWPNVRSVAVFPATSRPGLPFDGASFSRTLANELAAYPGFTRVIYPDEIAAALPRGASSLEDVLDAAEAMGADAVLALTILDHTPYPPKRISLAVELISVRDLAGGAMDIDELIRRGQWAPEAPMLPDDAMAGRVIDMVQPVFDLGQFSTKQEADWFDHSLTASGWDDGEHVANVESAFQRFIAHRVIRTLIDREVGRRNDVAR